jgi:hypothetical protein
LPSDATVTRFSALERAGGPRSEAATAAPEPEGFAGVWLDLHEAGWRVSVKQLTSIVRTADVKARPLGDRLTITGEWRPG